MSEQHLPVLTFSRSLFYTEPVRTNNEMSPNAAACPKDSMILSAESGQTCVVPLITCSCLSALGVPKPFEELR